MDTFMLKKKNHTRLSGWTVCKTEEKMKNQQYNGHINRIIIQSIYYWTVSIIAYVILDCCKDHYGTNNRSIREIKESFQLVSYSISQQFFYKV